jgi:hypothetical protein
MISMVHDGWVGTFWICWAGFDRLRCRGGEELSTRGLEDRLSYRAAGVCGRIEMPAAYFTYVEMPIILRYTDRSL